MTRDNIFAATRNARAFQFDEEVVRVFPDMISRSVPGYAAMLAMIEQIASRFGKPDTYAYDLGCSLGAATFRIQAGMPEPSKIVGVDNSAAMIRQFEQELSERGNPSTKAIEVHEADIIGFGMQHASLVVLNLTLQFLPLASRSALLGDIFEALIPGGALLLSEKICFEDSHHQDTIFEMHHDYKRANGYSDLEIAQKRNALENTLVPETMDAHIQRLQSVGFGLTVPWFQCFNFVSLLAVKSENSNLGKVPEGD